MALAQSLWMLYLARVIDGATAGNLSLAQAYIADNTAAREARQELRPHRHRVRRGLLPRAVGHGRALRALRAARADLPGRVHVGDEHPLHARSSCRTRSRPRSADGAPGPGGKRLEPVGLGRVRPVPVAAGAGRAALPVPGVHVLLRAVHERASRSSPSAASPGRRQPFGPREIGYLFAYSGFLGIMLQGGLIGRLVKRFGEPALVMTGFVALAVRLRRRSAWCTPFRS